MFQTMHLSIQNHRFPSTLRHTHREAGIEYGNVEKEKGRGRDRREK